MTSSYEVFLPYPPIIQDEIDDDDDDLDFRCVTIMASPPLYEIQTHGFKMGFIGSLRLQHIESDSGYISSYFLFI